LNRIDAGTILGVFLVAVSAAALLWVLPGEVQAAEKLSEGRKLYDTVMRWVNFGILVFFFMKYGKPALARFLQGERNRVQKQLHEIEVDLNLAKQRVNEESKKLEGIEEYLQEIQSSILEMGGREKERILKEARNSADSMIQEAEGELGLKMEEARRFLNDRITEQAVGMARQKLMAGFSDQDNDRHVEGFVGRLGRVKDEKDLAL